MLSRQQEFNGLHVLQDPPEVVRVLAVGVRGPRREAGEEHRGRRAQQDDMVELGIEGTLIRRAATDEEQRVVVRRQELVQPAVDRCLCAGSRRTFRASVRLGGCTNESRLDERIAHHEGDRGRR